MSASDSDFSMQELFQKDLAMQLQVLAPEKDLLDKDATLFCQALSNLAANMQGPARIMQYTQVVDALQALSVCCKSLIAFKEPSSTLKEFQRIVSELLAVLKKMLEAPPPLLTKTVEESSAVLQACTAALQALPIKTDAAQIAPRQVQHEHKHAHTVTQSDRSIITLFFVDLETYTRLLQDGLLALEMSPFDEQLLASLMRAAHSIKGAARVMGLEELVHLAHALEEFFLHLQKQHIEANRQMMDLLFKIVDLFSALVKQQPEALSAWLSPKKALIEGWTQQLMQWIAQPPPAAARPAEDLALERLEEIIRLRREPMLRMQTGYLNRLMGLAGELLVELRYLQPFAQKLMQLKKMQYEQSALIDALRDTCNEESLGEKGETVLLELQRQTHACLLNTTDRLDELESFVGRYGSLSDSLYREVVSSRLCPFDEGIQDMPRMVRNLSKELDKQVHLEIVGRFVTVDREILDQLQTPLQHLLRNAVDHGIEPLQQRLALGKPAVGTIRLEAYHRAGLLHIVVADDGCGVDFSAVKKALVKRGTDSQAVSLMHQDELLSALFLPGFTTNIEATQISGRGFGLNTVQAMVHDVGGKILVESVEGKGTQFCLQLPLTLSILRALLVEISGEPYAFPLARTHRALLVSLQSVQQIENHYYTVIDDESVGLVWGYHLLDTAAPVQVEQTLPVVLVTQDKQMYGIVVDLLLGEKELIVQELDRKLGKIPMISCGALMEDGAPLLLLDVEEMIDAARRVLSTRELSLKADSEKSTFKPKRILVVDENATVANTEVRILQASGYRVSLASNGIEGWNMLLKGGYDLIITEITPEMEGLELIRLIKSAPEFKSLPVLIISCKEEPQDKTMGLQAGADAYLSKAGFQESQFLAKVHELLIGKAVC